MAAGDEEGKSQHFCVYLPVNPGTDGPVKQDIILAVTTLYFTLGVPLCLVVITETTTTTS